MEFSRSIYEIVSYFAKTPWHSLRTELGFHRNTHGDFRTGMFTFERVSAQGKVDDGTTIIIIIIIIITITSVI